MTKQQLENEVQRLREELVLANEKANDIDSKGYYIGQSERCRLYDEIFSSIKYFLESGGEIILRPGTVEIRGKE